jgi:hypothetical protein
LRTELRHSFPARATAIGFVILVLFGNLWVVYAIINAKAPPWVSYGFGAGLILTGVAGIGLLGVALQQFIKRLREPPQNDEQT